MRMKATLFLAAALYNMTSFAAAAAPDAAAYIAARGWRPYEQHKPLPRPAADIAPVLYFAPGDTAPSCGLLSQGKGAPAFIDVLRPERPGGFPQCLAIDAAAAFSLDKNPYLVFEIVNRDSKTDTYRQYFYVYKNSAGAWVKDEELHLALARSRNAPGFREKLKGVADGVRLAKASFIRKSMPGMTLSPRDSIYTDSASYAVLEDKAARQCAFVLEKAGTLFRFDHTTFAGGDKCTDVLATSKFNEKGKIYFMTMFKGVKQKRLAIVSVSQSNAVTAEKELAALALAKASLTDMRSVRMFIQSTMQ